jgi:hypothetical protein
MKLVPPLLKALFEPSLPISNVAPLAWMLELKEVEPVAVLKVVPMAMARSAPFFRKTPPTAALAALVTKACLLMSASSEIPGTELLLQFPAVAHNPLPAAVYRLPSR